MMNSKIILLSIAVLSVGLFAMPSTLSLFGGQHTFQNASVACTTCHADVYEEIKSGTAHTSIVTGDKKCEGCHQSGRIAANLIPTGNFSVPRNFTGDFGVGWNASDGNFTYPNATNVTYAAHAAITLECVFCHMGVNDSFTDDAHFELANQTPAGLMKGKNAVCVVCHTKAVKTITFQRYANITVEYNFTNETLIWSNGTINTTYGNRTT